MGLVDLFVVLCVCVEHCDALNGQGHLFENHELIQEVNALAGEEFPDGLLSLSTLRVRGNAHLRGLILEELSQRKVLHRQTTTVRNKEAASPSEHVGTEKQLHFLCMFSTTMANQT